MKTIARAHNGPIKTTAIGVAEGLRLALKVDTLKIDLFEVMEYATAVNKEITDPNELDFSRLSLGFPDLGYKFEHLNLLFAIATDANIVPGSSRASDELLIEKLRASFSDNLANPDEIIQEFIHLWNEVAALSNSAASIGDPNQPPPIFRTHENYLGTQFDFILRQINSILTPSFLCDIRKTRGLQEAAEEAGEEVVKSSILIAGEEVVVESSIMVDVANYFYEKQGWRPTPLRSTIPKFEFKPKSKELMEVETKMKDVLEPPARQFTPLHDDKEMQSERGRSRLRTKHHHSARSSSPGTSIQRSLSVEATVYHSEERPNREDQSRSRSRSRS